MNKKVTFLLLLTAISIASLVFFVGITYFQDIVFYYVFPALAYLFVISVMFIILIAWLLHGHDNDTKS